MKTTAVTVTYGNRFHLLKQVIDSALKEGVSKVIVVDNGSVPESREKLKNYEKELGKEKIKILYLDDNYGSAGGFKRGLEEANQDTEYILVLDDNLIEEKSIAKLETLTLYLTELKNNYILSFYREDNVEQGWIKRYLPNNFSGFNFLHVLKNKLFKSKKKNLINLFPLQPIEVTAMGGSFFHKSILDKIGYPNEDFYLYADDHDFTYRFTKSGGHIFLCSELKLIDLDSTTMSDKGKEIGYFDEEFSEFKMYYGIRNHTYLSKKFVNNKIFFYGNSIIFLLVNLFKIVQTPKKLFIKRYILLIRAVKDGLNENLGRIF